MTAPDYERQAWLDVQEHKRLQAERSPRALLPGAAREKLDDFTSRLSNYLDSTPGYEKFATTFARALEGIFKTVGKIGARSLSSRRIAGAYKKRGLPVASLEDVRRLPMQDVDAVKPSLDVAYASATAVSGTVLGFLAGGGTMVATGATVASGGAAAAPSMGVVASILATDAAVTLAAVHRGLAHVAGYYGYDYRKHDEQIFALGVMNAALAGSGKAAAYAELNKVVQKLARDATWRQLEEHALARISKKVLERYGYTITKRKLGEIVPVIGAVIGGGLNAHLLNSALEEIDVLYRERFLRDRYGPDGPDGIGAESFAAGPTPDLPGLVDIIEAEIVTIQEPPRADGSQA